MAAVSANPGHLHQRGAAHGSRYAGNPGRRIAGFGLTSPLWKISALNSIEKPSGHPRGLIKKRLLRSQSVASVRGHVSGATPTRSRSVAESAATCDPGFQPRLYSLDRPSFCPTIGVHLNADCELLYLIPGHEVLLPYKHRIFCEP